MGRRASGVFHTISYCTRFFRKIGSDLIQGLRTQSNSVAMPQDIGRSALRLRTLLAMQRDDITLEIAIGFLSPPSERPQGAREISKLWIMPQSSPQHNSPSQEYPKSKKWPPVQQMDSMCHKRQIIWHRDLHGPLLLEGQGPACHGRMHMG